MPACRCACWLERCVLLNGTPLTVCCPAHPQASSARCCTRCIAVWLASWIVGGCPHHPTCRLLTSRDPRCLLLSNCSHLRDAVLGALLCGEDQNDGLLPDGLLLWLHRHVLPRCVGPLGLLWWAGRCGCRRVLGGRAALGVAARYCVAPDASASGPYLRGAARPKCAPSPWCCAARCRVHPTHTRPPPTPPLRRPQHHVRSTGLPRCPGLCATHLPQCQGRYMDASSLQSSEFACTPKWVRERIG